MKKLKWKLFCFILASSIVAFPAVKPQAVTVSQISRADAEQRALSMINLTWTYSPEINNIIDPEYAPLITTPTQLTSTNIIQSTGIPYDWGGLDGIDSSSGGTSWTSFQNAIFKGAFAGNVNTEAGYGYISGTAGIDCSGFVQATFNIKDSKLCTSTVFNDYFNKIDINDIKHMDILDKPGDHIVIFDKWGTLNGVSGAYTYESTPDQTYGGIQGTKKYFISMTEINSGYIAGRYSGIVEDSTQNSLQKGSFALISNVNYNANLRSSPSTSASIIDLIPKDTAVYLIDSNSGWYEINYNNKIGWVNSSLLAAVPKGCYVSIKNAYSLNIRNTPSASSQILGVLYKDQYAKVLDYSSDGKWFKISINGIEGWSSASYLSYIY